MTYIGLIIPFHFHLHAGLSCLEQIERLTGEVQDLNKQLLASRQEVSRLEDTLQVCVSAIWQWQLTCCLCYHSVGCTQYIYEYPILGITIAMAWLCTHVYVRMVCVVLLSLKHPCIEQRGLYIYHNSCLVYMYCVHRLSVMVCLFFYHLQNLIVYQQKIR